MWEPLIQRFGNIGNVGFANTYNFELRFYLTLVPNTHQLRWFFSRWLISLKWIQLLCHCLISLSLDWFSHKVGFQYYPYLQQGHKNRFLFYSQSTLDDWCLNYSTIWLCRFTTNSSRNTLWASYGYPLFSQFHTELITLSTSQNSKNCQKTFVSKIH